MGGTRKTWSIAAALAFAVALPAGAEDHDDDAVDDTAAQDPDRRAEHGSRSEDSGNEDSESQDSESQDSESQDSESQDSGGPASRQEDSDKGPEAAPSAGRAGSPASTLGDTDPRTGDVVVRYEGRVPRAWIDHRDDEYPLQPARWRNRLPRECRTRGGYREHCQGPRDVPTPHGRAADLARRFGLGKRLTARVLLHGPPFDEWLGLVEAMDPEERLTFPVPSGHMGRGFGRVRSGSVSRRRHKGVDIGADEGAPIVAARGGLVVFSDDELTGYGNVVMLLHKDGFSTLYAHCKRTLVFAGQEVARGQQIAEVGQTGFAWGPHLHFEWRQAGWVRDPAPHFMPRGDD